MYDFDKPINRQGTHCVKWDMAPHYPQTPTPNLPSVANEGFAPLCGAAATPVAALKSSVANEGFAPLGGAAATPVAALKTPVAPVASEGGECAPALKEGCD